SLRRPAGAISTARVEEDEFEIVSGVFEGKTTGTPLCLLIPNRNVRSGDYEATKDLARPGHADYTGFIKYHGFADYRGGGHFSGRVTAALVALGAIAQTALEGRGIKVGTHIARLSDVSDRGFSDYSADLAALSDRPFPVLDENAGERMRAAILSAKEDNDSVGGILETAVTGLPAGVGEPWFDTLEGVLSHGLFSIPGVKGVEFGDGFALAGMRGSEANDAFVPRDGGIATATNRNGGINGGISNGMPLLFRCAVKPTPSIAKTQSTVDIKTGAAAELSLVGRHDPAIVHRARAVVDAVTALVLSDALAGRYGVDWLGGIE
ncbi:MAG: chorismate synthase, partial [Clostridia bacterium]|nr:chorismate synthase [Clostridia bacterium]